MDLVELIDRATAQAAKSGFTKPEPRSVDTHVALMMTELAELYEAHRDGQKPNERWYEHRGHYVSQSPYNEEREVGKPVGIPSELADLVIRACNMAGEWQIDLVGAIQEKMSYNATRPRMHGRKL